MRAVQEYENVRTQACEKVQGFGKVGECKKVWGWECKRMHEDESQENSSVPTPSHHRVKVWEPLHNIKPEEYERLQECKKTWEYKFVREYKKDTLVPFCLSLS